MEKVLKNGLGSRPRHQDTFLQALLGEQGLIVPGDPKKGIPLFGILRGASVLTKLPTKHIFRFLIKSWAYSDKYF